MFDWFATTLRTNPEIAIFLALALGYYFGKFTFKGFGLGAVTSTLIAGVVIGQIGITTTSPQAFSFLMFCSPSATASAAVRARIAKDGVRRRSSRWSNEVLPDYRRRVANRTATIRLRPVSTRVRRPLRSMGLATAYQSSRPGRRPSKALIDGMPVLTAGATCSAHGLGAVSHDRPGAAAHRSRRRLTGLRGETGRRQKEAAGPARLAPLGVACVQGAAGWQGVGIRVAEAESMVPDARSSSALRRDGQIMEATSEIVLKDGDVVAVAGEREVLVTVLQAGSKSMTASCWRAGGRRRRSGDEQGDRRQDADRVAARPMRAAFPAQITRGATATDIPSASTQINAATCSPLSAARRTCRRHQMLGVADRPTESPTWRSSALRRHWRVIGRWSSRWRGAAYAVDRRRRAHRRDRRRGCARYAQAGRIPTPTVGS